MRWYLLGCLASLLVARVSEENRTPGSGRPSLARLTIFVSAIARPSSAITISLQSRAAGIPHSINNGAEMWTPLPLPRHAGVVWWEFYGDLSGHQKANSLARDVPVARRFELSTD